MQDDYYIKKTLTLLVKHGIENKPEQILKDNFAVVSGETGSEVMIIDPQRSNKEEVKIRVKTEELI